jgi:hypothetical protein
LVIRFHNKTTRADLTSPCLHTALSAVHPLCHPIIL